MKNMDNENYDNDLFFDNLKNDYPQLAQIKVKENILTYKDYILSLKGFSLCSLKKDTFLLLPYDFINIIKIHLDVLEENNYLEKNDFNINYAYLRIRTYLVKNLLTGDEIEEIKFFIQSFLVLFKNQDYLVDKALDKFINMQNIIRDSLYDAKLDTPGIRMIKDELNGSDFLSEKGPKLVLINSNYPETINSKVGKEGFGATSLIIYIVINIGIILAVFLLK